MKKFMKKKKQLTNFLFNFLYFPLIDPKNEKIKNNKIINNK